MALECKAGRSPGLGDIRRVSERHFVPVPCSSVSWYLTQTGISCFLVSGEYLREGSECGPQPKLTPFIPGETKPVFRVPALERECATNKKVFLREQISIGTSSRM